MPRTVKAILEDDDKKPALPETGADDGSIGTDEGAIGLPAYEDHGEGAASPNEGKKGPDPLEEASALRAQLEKERAAHRATAARAAEAEKLASSASVRANDAVEKQIVTRENEIESNISKAKTNLESIKQQLKTARQAGDTDAEVDLQDAMTNARYELNVAEWDKKNFAVWKDNRKKEMEKQATADPQSPYTKKEQAWIRQHDEFNTNKKFARIAKVAAQEAREEGHEQDSPEYFSYIEDALKEAGFMQEKDPVSGAASNKEATASVAAAPQKTGAGTASSASGPNAKYPFIPRGFRIPADWVQAAEDQGFDDPREYANMRLEEEAKEKGAQ